MALISDSAWAKFASIQRKFHDSAMQEEVTWRRTVVSRQRFNDGEDRTEDVILRGLIHYNHFRNWPINKLEATGEIDQESILLYLNEDYLEEQGLLDANKQFNFDQSLDRFIIEGLVYKPRGYSKAAQLKETTLLAFIILSREELMTGD